MAARRDVLALARFLHRNQLPGEKEKNVLAASQPRPAVAKPRAPSALRSFGKAFFSFSRALGTHGAQKRAKAPTSQAPRAPPASLLDSLINMSGPRDAPGLCGGGAQRPWGGSMCRGWECC